MNRLARRLKKRVYTTVDSWTVFSVDNLAALMGLNPADERVLKMDVVLMA